MATSLTSSVSTREKLLHARAAASRLAQLSTEHKNGVLMAMAQEIDAKAESIAAANRVDRSGAW